MSFFTKNINALKRSSFFFSNEKYTLGCLEDKILRKRKTIQIYHQHTVYGRLASNNESNL